jgi:hypothetical protein
MDEFAKLRAEIVEAVSERVNAALGSTLSGHECLAVAIAAACPRDRAGVLGLLATPAQLRRLEGREDAVKLHRAEWSALFGRGAPGASEGGVAAVLAEPHVQGLLRSLEDSLRCSLLERDAKAAWYLPLARLSCYLSLHTEEAEELVAACLGGVVRSDSRRFDDVRSSVEEAGGDELVLTRAAIALSKAVAQRGAD